MATIEINIHDRLLAEAKNKGIDISSICQRTLELAVASTCLTLAELTPRSWSVLAAAAKEADHLGQGFIGTEHLLLGILAENGGIAAQVLTELGLADEVAARIRAVIVASQSQQHPSNRALDRNGDVLGYMVRDNDGSLVVLSIEGKRVHVTEEGGELIARDETGAVITAVPVSEAPRVVSFDDSGHPIVVVNVDGQQSTSSDQRGVAPDWEAAP